jgi:hypothetical protein
MGQTSTYLIRTLELDQFGVYRSAAASFTKGGSVLLMPLPK